LQHVRLLAVHFLASPLANFVVKVVRLIADLRDTTK